MELYEAIEKRRIVRDFKDEEVPLETIEKIIGETLRAFAAEAVFSHQYNIKLISFAYVIKPPAEICFLTPVKQVCPVNHPAVCSLGGKRKRKYSRNTENCGNNQNKQFSFHISAPLK